MKLPSLLTFLVLVGLSGKTIAQPCNLQPFNGSLLDISAPTVNRLNNKFVVTDNGKQESFTDVNVALTKSCDIQESQCQKASKCSNKKVSEQDCKDQLQQCLRACGIKTGGQGKKNKKSKQVQPPSNSGDDNNSDTNTNTKGTNAQTDNNDKSKQASSVESDNDKADNNSGNSAKGDSNQTDKGSDASTTGMGIKTADSNKKTNDNSKKTEKNVESGKSDVVSDKAVKKEDPTQPTGLKKDAGFCPAVGLGNAINDGTQKKTQTCSTTVQGAIPTFDKMVSTIILSPKSGEKIKMGTDVKVKVRTNNMQLGFFEDPNKQYYQSPQTLNNQGVIEGHQHLSVQNLGNGETPPDPRTESLAFFKGLDAKSNDGILEITVPGESFKSPGEYRFCTITGSRTHQPVIMPVAKRGSQDDCIRVTVI